jgi:predicted enzyme related to lactoylglutathione lyase
MKTLVAFFEIPAVDFNRAIKFYETILNVKLASVDCGHEKMAFFPEENGFCPGAISWAADNSFLPSKDGVLVSLNVDSIEKASETISKLGGKILISKTKIEADGRGYFSVFLDSEGNRVGLYSDR